MKLRPRRTFTRTLVGGDLFVALCQNGQELACLRVAPIQRLRDRVADVEEFLCCVVVRPKRARVVALRDGQHAGRRSGTLARHRRGRRGRQGRCNQATPGDRVHHGLAWLGLNERGNLRRDQRRGRPGGRRIGVRRKVEEDAAEAVDPDGGGWPGDDGALALLDHSRAGHGEAGHQVAAAVTPEWRRSRHVPGNTPAECPSGPATAGRGGEPGQREVHGWAAHRGAARDQFHRQVAVHMAEPLQMAAVEVLGDLGGRAAVHDVGRMSTVISRPWPRWRKSIW